MHIDIFLYDTLWYSRIVSTTLVIEDVFQELHTKINGRAQRTATLEEEGKSSHAGTCERALYFRGTKRPLLGMDLATWFIGIPEIMARG